MGVRLAAVTSVRQSIATEVAADAPSVAAQVGAASFSDLVRAHFRREQERRGSDAARLAEAEDEFRRRLEQFEREEGRIGSVYWSTRNASAVALTIGSPHRQHNPLVDTEMTVRLHRLTDWVVDDADTIAEVLHEADVLAIRVSEILRGTSERIALRWIFAVEEHLLGHIERCGHVEAPKDEAVATAQRHELARIEEYYLRAGAKAARIVYLSGMMIGSLLIVAGCAIAAAILASNPAQWTEESQALLLCTGAGAVGALVSVLSRMSSGSDKFSIDFEVGRPLLRRLGLYKPLVGSVFGVALYFLLASGLLMTNPPSGNRIYFYGIIAFFAGFSERFTGVIFGDAQRLVSGGGSAPSAGHADADEGSA
jgi:hypothetical protein